MYHKEKKSTIKIANELGKSKGWVLKKMNIYQIPRRNLQQATTLRMENEYGSGRKHVN